VLYADQTIGQFRKLLASTIAVKGGRVEQSNTMFDMTTFHCSGRG